MKVVKKARMIKNKYVYYLAITFGTFFTYIAGLLVAASFRFLFQNQVFFVAHGVALCFSAFFIYSMWKKGKNYKVIIAGITGLLFFALLVVAINIHFNHVDRLQ